MLAYSMLYRWTPERRELDYLRMLGAAVVVFWLLQMDYFGFRPWRAIWASRWCKAAFSSPSWRIRHG